LEAEVAMAELFERCPVCHGSRTIPFGTKVCDYPTGLTPPACPCTLGPTPGWMASGLTVEQFEALRQRNRETEDQLVWLADWCRQTTGVENNKVIGRDGWPHRVCEVVGKAVEEHAAKAERFKAFVHDYLTQHGVPEGDPENRHQKEGCRIGARLDLMFAERDKLRSIVAQLIDGVQHVVELCDQTEEVGMPLNPKELRHHCHGTMADTDRSPLPTKFADVSGA
jgi:hypothetical protein